MNYTFENSLQNSLQNTSQNNFGIIIMAGGLGKRMNSDLPKVLHKLNNIPLIIHILKTIIEIKPTKIFIIVGKYKTIIENTIKEYIPLNIIEENIIYVIQENPLGTGHAIHCCKSILTNYKNIINKICILSGDVPLIKSNTILNLLNNTKESNILTANIDEPYGYGRIILDNSNNIKKIVEEKDCNLDEKQIKLINSGIYSFNINIIIEYIDLIDNNNSQNEYYLTQIFELLVKNNISINYNIINNIIEITGINTQEQLKELEKIKE